MLINSADFSRCIKSASTLLNLSSPNEREQTLRLTSTEDKLSILGLSTDSHLFKFNINIQDENKTYIDCYIKADKLINLLSLLSSVNDFELTLEENGLVFSHEKYGAVTEALYFNQEAFEGIKFNLENYTPLNSKDIYNLLTSISSYNNPQALFKISNGCISLYGYYSEGGVFRYRINNDLVVQKDINFYTNFSILKNISNLGKELKLSYCTSPLGLKTVSNIGEIIIKCSFIKNDEFEIIDYVNTLEVLASITIDSSELINAVNWQTHNYTLGQSIYLSSKDNSFNLKTENKSPSNINCSEGEIQEIKVSISGLLSLLKVVGKNTKIDIKQYLLNYGELEVKVLEFFFTPKNLSIVECSALIYEQVTYE